MGLSIGSHAPSFPFLPFVCKSMLNCENCNLQIVAASSDFASSTGERPLEFTFRISFRRQSYADL